MTPLEFVRRFLGLRTGNEEEEESICYCGAIGDEPCQCLPDDLDDLADIVSKEEE